jgi:hypothetical protein
MQVAPSTSAGEIRYASPETDWEAGTVSRELLTAARAAAVLQASATAAAGTASTGPASQTRPGRRYGWTFALPLTLLPIASTPPCCRRSPDRVDPVDSRLQRDAVDRVTERETPAQATFRA